MRKKGKKRKNGRMGRMEMIVVYLCEYVVSCKVNIKLKSVFSGFNRRTWMSECAMYGLWK